MGQKLLPLTYPSGVADTQRHFLQAALGMARRGLGMTGRTVRRRRLLRLCQ